jgi:hypothetical protein
VDGTGSGLCSVAGFGLSCDEPSSSATMVLIYFFLPEFSFFRCIFDACGCDLGGDCECLCTAISAYAQACNIRGSSIKWRTQQLCRKCWALSLFHFSLLQVHEFQVCMGFYMIIQKLTVIIEFLFLQLKFVIH